MFDHDGDGIASLIVPLAGSSDGSALTVEGNLTAYALNSTAVGASTSVVQPWSIPTNVKAIDMNGDGVVEHIVAAGELSSGLFIASWQHVTMDIDDDGQDDLGAEGYAGDAAYGMEPLYLSLIHI